MLHVRINVSIFILHNKTDTWYTLYNIKELRMKYKILQPITFALLVLLKFLAE